MFRQVASFGVAIIAAVTTSLCAVSIPSGAARAAENCLSAPQGAAPAGSHWRYRTDRASQRKCWYLSQEGRKAPRMAQSREPQPQAETPPAVAPQMKDVVARLTEPLVGPSDLSPRPLDQTDPRTSMNAFADPTPMRTPEPAPRVADSNDQLAGQAKDQTNDQTTSAASPQEPANEATETATPAVEPSQQVQAPAQEAAPAKESAAFLDADTMRMLPFAIAALGAACFLAGAILYASGAKRRQDAVVRILDLNEKAPRRPWATTSSDVPLSSSMRLETEIDVEDDVRRGPPPWRERAA